jgi:AcrR family transcriptional regulator
MKDMTDTASLASAGPAASPFRSAAERERDKENKRQALLTAAVTMFNERGFHATSLDDVAASLGVTKPVIYHHLGNKDQVLLECMRLGLAKLEAAALDAQGRAGTGADRLRSLLLGYAEHNMTPFGACVVLTPDYELSPDSRATVRGMKRRVDRIMRDMIAEATGDGSARIADVRLAGFALAGALNWIPRWYRADGERSAAEIATSFVDTLMQGMVTAG